MHKKKDIFITTIFFLILTIFLISGTYYYILNKQENLLTSIYNSTNKNIQKLTESLLTDKKNTILSIALSLARDDKLHNYMDKQEYDKLDYQNISDQMKDHTKFKNIWIQLVDKNGNSVYRSWTDKKGDNLLFRKDLKKSIENRDISTSISVGLFALTIKARAPIFDDNNDFLGSIEVIGHFSSLTNDLKENKIDSVVVTEKKFREILKFPFSNLFIDDYYIANENANKDLVEYLKNNNVEKHLQMDNYIIENNYLISKYNLINERNEKLACILNFVKLDDIDTQIVTSSKIQIIMLCIIIVIILFFSFLIYLYTIYLNQIKLEENKKQSILDSQKNIIVITNGEELIDANQRLFDFYENINNLEDFKKKYTCICTTFLYMNDESYVVERLYDGKNWAEYILANQNKNFRVAIKDINDETRHFTVNCSLIPPENFIIATFTDITQEIIQIENNKEKEKILFQQSKISAITDILKNISHQWRQPLSVISTIASGMKLKKEIDTLSDKDFNESCDSIVINTNKLSNTIENFSNFFNSDDKIIEFSLIEILKNIKEFMDSIFEENHIKCIFIYDNDFILNCNKNDFSQAILNILDNSIHALTTTQDENNRFIFIEFNNNILQIKDSGNGIDENVISKILEPYFTTKHQSFGVGLGLYVVNELFVKNMGYKIDIKNIAFTYKNVDYKGTNFIIDFN